MIGVVVMTCKTWLEHYLFSFKKNKIKNSSYNYYRERFEALKPLYDLELEKLTLFDVQNFINTYQQEHSYSTVRGCFVLLQQAFSKAVSAGFIKINPCDGVELPHPEKQEVDSLSDFELKQLFTCNQRSYYYPIFLFLLFSGMRVGEALALSPSDIDFKNKIIHVDNNFYRGELSTPKTLSGFRELPLTPELEKIICRARSARNILFPNTLGERIDYHVLLTAWHRQQTSCGFIKLHGLHSLRHTFASNLIHSGADVKTVSLLLGHKDIQTTLNFYCHADIKQKRDVISLLNFKSFSR